MIFINGNCDSCGREIVFIETPHSVHYGKLECSHCGKWFKWIRNPNNESIRTKASKYDLKRIKEYHKFHEYFCFFCLRTQKELGLNEILTRDHIKELNKGGSDILENLQILCSACHKLKNWSRLYLNWHLTKNERGKEDTG